MLVPLLHLAKWFYKEPCSVQKEIINRSAKKRGSWDATNDEIIDIYDHLDVLVKKRTRIGKLTPAQFFTLIKHPTSRKFRLGRLTFDKNLRQINK